MKQPQTQLLSFSSLAIADRVTMHGTYTGVSDVGGGVTAPVGDV